MTQVPSYAIIAAVAAGVLTLGLAGLATLRNARARAALADAPLLGRMVRLPGPSIGWLRTAAVTLAATALGAALAIGAGGRATSAAGGDRETVLVLDASNSMRVRDVAPNRLVAQRRLARQLVSGLSGRVGVVYFAGRGYVLTPLTTDLDAVLMFTDTVDPDVVGRGGTSLVFGIRQALGVLAGGEPNATRSIVLFSDGEATLNADDLDPVLAQAEDAGVQVYTVGIGTKSGGRIPLPPDDSAGAASADDSDGRFLRDPDGQVVVSRLEEGALRALATGGHGVYVPGFPVGIRLLLREMGFGEHEAATNAGGAMVHPLLLLAFLLLWGEAYLTRRG